jgi:hypothetical protein
MDMGIADQRDQRLKIALAGAEEVIVEPHHRAIFWFDCPRPDR